MSSTQSIICCFSFHILQAFLNSLHWMVGPVQVAQIPPVKHPQLPNPAVSSCPHLGGPSAGMDRDGQSWHHLPSCNAPSCLLHTLCLAPLLPWHLPSGNLHTQEGLSRLQPGSLSTSHSLSTWQVCPVPEPSLLLTS